MRSLAKALGMMVRHLKYCHPTNTFILLLVHPAAVVSMPLRPRGILLQGFEWYSEPGQWQRLQAQLAHLKDLGVDNIWLPPGCKAGSPKSNGYNTYDLYDLGEFDQKGSRATKWGSEQELLRLVNAAQAIGIGLMWDAVLGHKASADRTKVCRAVEVLRR